MKHFLSWEIVMVMINWKQDIVSSNSVCKHTRDKQIGLPLRVRVCLKSLADVDYTITIINSPISIY